MLGNDSAEICWRLSRGVGESHFHQVKWLSFYEWLFATYTG